MNVIPCNRTLPLLDRRLIVQRVIATYLVVGDGVDDHQALNLAAVPGFVESADTYRECLKQSLDEITLRVVEITLGISRREWSDNDVIDEKHRFDC